MKWIFNEAELFYAAATSSSSSCVNQKAGHVNSPRLFNQRGKKKSAILDDSRRYFIASPSSSKNSPQSLRQRRGLAAGWLRPPPYRINDTGFAPSHLPPGAVIKPGLWPSSKLLFSPRQIYSSIWGADGHLARPPALARNRPLRLGLLGTSSSDRCLKRVRRAGGTRTRGDGTFRDPRNLHFSPPVVSCGNNELPGLRLR